MNRERRRRRRRRRTEEGNGEGGKEGEKDERKKSEKSIKKPQHATRKRKMDGGLNHEGAHQCKKITTQHPSVRRGRGWLSRSMECGIFLGKRKG